MDPEYQGTRLSFSVRAPGHALGFPAVGVAERRLSEPMPRSCQAAIFPAHSAWSTRWDSRRSAEPTVGWTSGCSRRPGKGSSGTSRGARRPRFGSGFGEAIQDQLADPGGVGLAAGGLHDRADEDTRRGDACRRGSSRPRRGWRRWRRPRRLSRALSSLTTARPRAATTSSGAPSPASTPSSDLAGQLVVERAGGHQLGDPGDLGRGDGAARPARRRSALARRRSSPSHHLRASAGGRTGRHGVRDQVEGVGVDAARPCPGRTGPTRPAAGRGGPRAARAAMRADLLHPLGRDGASGTRSGSGKYR